jgi:hypothetical protein
MVQETPRTGRKTSMPPRSKSPGLKRGRHGLPYWIARQVVRDPMEFPDRCIPLPHDADEEALSELCRRHTARLFAWIDQQSASPDDPMPRYDGSVASLYRLYQQHPDSSFHDVKRNTRKTYTDSLKVIEGSVGARLVRRVTTLDVKRWHRAWKAPKVAGGRPRIDRAHDAVSMFRQVLRFGAALRFTECGVLDAELAKLRFERGGAREQQMTFTQATAAVRKAIELGASGLIPVDRARSMAIGIAAQFDLLLRQKDVIGEWQPAAPEVAGAIYSGEEMWTGRFRWENVPGWRLRLKTSKTRSAIEFDLTNYSLLFPLLDAVPMHERVGAIVKGEHGLPVRERSYRKWYRQIARAAGIPDDVWLMDSRAGGATEADEAGADLKAISDHLTHSKTSMTVRYIRNVTGRTKQVADARNRKREADQSGDGTM